MVEITATEFARNFGRYKEAAQREPIAITSYGRTSGYFLSSHEYEEYQRLKALSRQSYSLSELPENLMDEIRNARMDLRHKHLDSLLAD